MWVYLTHENCSLQTASREAARAPPARSLCPHAMGNQGPSCCLLTPQHHPVRRAAWPEPPKGRAHVQVSDIQIGSVSKFSDIVLPSTDSCQTARTFHVGAQEHFPHSCLNAKVRVARTGCPGLTALSSDVVSASNFTGTFNRSHLHYLDKQTSY